jgi:WD40 repeat protein
MLFEKPWEHATVDSQPHIHGTKEHPLLSFLLLDGVVKLLQSPMSQLVYTGSLDGKVRAWDGCTGNCECTYQGHIDSILDIASTKCVFLSPMAFSCSDVKVPSKSEEQTTVHFH